MTVCDPAHRGRLPSSTAETTVLGVRDGGGGHLPLLGPVRGVTPAKFFKILDANYSYFLVHFQSKN